MGALAQDPAFAQALQSQAAGGMSPAGAAGGGGPQLQHRPLLRKPGVPPAQPQWPSRTPAGYQIPMQPEFDTGGTAQPMPGTSPALQLGPEAPMGVAGSPDMLPSIFNKPLEFGAGSPAAENLLALRRPRGGAAIQGPMGGQAPASSSGGPRLSYRAPAGVRGGGFDWKADRARALGEAGMPTTLLPVDPNARPTKPKPMATKPKPLDSPSTKPPVGTKPKPSTGRRLPYPGG